MDQNKYAVTKDGVIVVNVSVMTRHVFQASTVSATMNHVTAIWALYVLEMGIVNAVLVSALKDGPSQTVRVAWIQIRV